MNLKQVIQQHTETAIRDRRYLHENAEIGLELPETKAYVMRRLTEMGYDPKPCGQSGVTATVGTGTGPVLLLRADMDALPVPEESGEPFASKNGHMHGCGHDLHTAILLGTAAVLKEKEEELGGTVKLMFQPAEEIFAGAREMIENGVLENPKVDAALALHVFSEMPVGEILMREGSFMASVNGFQIDIKGRGCHGAQPENGVDPILIGTHIHQNLQALPARETSLTDGVLVTIGKFAAGNAANVIPDTAEMLGTMRTFNEPIREEMTGRIENIVTQTAQMFRGEAAVTWLSDVPCVINDEGFTRTIRRILDETEGLPEVGTAEPLTGSEDFAFVAKEVPSTLFLLGTAHEDPDMRYPQHHPKVVFNEEAIPAGIHALSACAIRWLNEQA